MTREAILDAFTRILRDLLSDDAIVLTMATRRDEVPNWDSLSYMTFIAAVELELGVRFGVADIESFDNVGAIVARTSEMLPSAVDAGTRVSVD
jgi:acyl carrier protein